MTTTTKVTNDDLPELVGQIIDVFEDFLDSKGIKLPNDEKDEAIYDGEDHDGIANIYGTDYGQLQDGIENILMNWELAEERGNG